jgi:hypothetical protein
MGKSAAAAAFPAVFFVVFFLVFVEAFLAGIVLSPDDEVWERRAGEPASAKEVRCVSIESGPSTSI